MFLRVTQWCLLLAVSSLLLFLSGCASEESDNASMRPWNSPAGWEAGPLGNMQNQHR
jgi:hypothetical protein